MTQSDQNALTLRRDAEELGRLCQRQNPGAAVDIRALFRSVADLLRVTGVCTPSEKARIFQDAARREPKPAILRAAYLNAARSADPLSREISGPDLRSGLDALARVRWAGRAARQRGVRRQSLVGAHWRDLNEVERAEVRQMARDLARFQRAKITRAAARKTEMDTLLLRLADIFVQHAGLKGGTEELPAAPASIFISFCVVALQPLARPPRASEKVRADVEVSAEALGSRWKRLKRMSRTQMPVLRPKPGRPKRPRGTPGRPSPIQSGRGQ